MDKDFEIDEVDMKYFNRIKDIIHPENKSETPDISMEEALTDKQKEALRACNMVAEGYQVLVRDLQEGLDLFEPNEQEEILQEVNQWHEMLVHLNDYKEDIVQSFLEGNGLQDAFHLSNRTVWCFYHIAKLQAERRDFQSACSLFYLLSELSPKISEFWMGVGISFHAMENYERAIFYYQKAALLDPEDPMLNLLEAECLILTHKKAEAKKALEIAKEKNDKKPSKDALFDQIHELEEKLLHES